MSGAMTTLEQNIARLEQAIADAKEATREAHAAIKDLREERKQVDYLLGTTATKLVDQRVAELVKTELDAVAPKLREFSSDIYARVQREVDKLLSLCLGQEFSTKHGHEDLRPALAAKLREWLHDEIGKAS